VTTDLAESAPVEQFSSRVQDTTTCNGLLMDGIQFSREQAERIQTNREPAGGI